MKRILEHLLTKIVKPFAGKFYHFFIQKNERLFLSKSPKFQQKYPTTS